MFSTKENFVFNCNLSLSYIKKKNYCNDKNDYYNRVYLGL